MCVAGDDGHDGGVSIHVACGLDHTGAVLHIDAMHPEPDENGIVERISHRELHEICSIRSDGGLCTDAVEHGQEHFAGDGIHVGEQDVALNGFRAVRMR